GDQRSAGARAGGLRASARARGARRTRRGRGRDGLRLRHDAHARDPDRGRDDHSTLPRGQRRAGMARHVHGMSPLHVRKIAEFRWELPREGAMRVPGLIFADRDLLEQILKDKTPDQVRNAACLPGILEASIAMPDAHWGYGLPIGGVVATDPDE